MAGGSRSAIGHRLSESGHALKVFDSSFGLTAIALSDETAFDSVLTAFTLQASGALRRNIPGAALAATIEEMAEIFRRPWIVDETPATIH